MIIKKYNVDKFNRLYINPTQRLLEIYNICTYYSFFFSTIIVSVLLLFTFFSSFELSVDGNIFLVVIWLAPLSLKAISTFIDRKLKQYKEELSNGIYLELTNNGTLIYKANNNTQILNSVRGYGFVNDRSFVVNGENSKPVVIPKSIDSFPQFLNTLKIVIDKNAIYHKLYNDALILYRNDLHKFFYTICNLQYLMIYNTLPLHCESVNAFIDPLTQEAIELEIVEQDNCKYLCIYSSTGEIETDAFNFIKASHFNYVFNLISYQYADSVIFSQLSDQNNLGILINKNTDKVYITPLKEINNNELK